LRDCWLTADAWQDDLAGIRLSDPACGSGAFLIEAFDQLHAAYQASNDRLQELRGHRSPFDLDRRILEHNLYGVDLNDEAIEISRLSLWIKTAQRAPARGRTLMTGVFHAEGVLHRSPGSAQRRSRGAPPRVITKRSRQP
jgi:hypothetical protein